MNEEIILQQIKEYGYYLLPKSHPGSPGHPGLLVAIRDKPTLMHFDPEGIHLHLCDNDGTSEAASLSLHSPFAGPREVCPGQIVLHDRIDKRAYFFIFGGSVEAVFRPGEVIYSVTSPAPILEVTNYPDHVADLLASETEAMLGGIKALWGIDDKGFMQQLARIDPLSLYRASLHTIVERYERAPALRQTFREFYAALIKERDWLATRGEWPASTARLEYLLAPVRGAEE